MIVDCKWASTIFRRLSSRPMVISNPFFHWYAIAGSLYFLPMEASWYYFNSCNLCLIWIQNYAIKTIRGGQKVLWVSSEYVRIGAMKYFSIRVFLLVTLGLFCWTNISLAFEYDEYSLLFVNRACYKTLRTNHVHNISKKKKDDKTDHMVLFGQKSLVIWHDTRIGTVDKKTKPFLTPNLHPCSNKAPPFQSWKNQITASSSLPPGGGELSNAIPDAAHEDNGGLPSGRRHGAECPGQDFYTSNLYW